MSRLENPTSHSVPGSPAQLAAGAPRQRDGRAAQRRRRPRLRLQGPDRQHPPLQRGQPSPASSSEEILFMRTFKCIIRPPVPREVVLQCTIDTATFLTQVSVLSCSNISSENIFIKY